MREISEVIFSGSGIMLPGDNTYQTTFRAKDGKFDLWYEPGECLVHVRRGASCRSVHSSQTRSITFTELPAFPKRAPQKIDAKAVA
jgi:hypothetical protein